MNNKNQTIFFYGHGNCFYANGMGRMVSKQVQPFIINKGKSKMVKPTDNGENTKPKEFYNRQKANCNEIYTTKNTPSVT